MLYCSSSPSCRHIEVVLTGTQLRVLTLSATSYNPNNTLTALSAAMFNPAGSTGEVQAEYLCVTVLAFLLAYVLYQRHLASLASIPGPYLATLTSLWLANAYRKQTFHWDCLALHKEYGPVVRVGPNAVSVGDHEAIKVIYGM